MTFLVALMCFLIAGGIFSAMLWHGDTHKPLLVYVYTLFILGWLILYVGS